MTPPVANAAGSERKLRIRQAGVFGRYPSGKVAGRATRRPEDYRELLQSLASHGD